jgi:hypothetical protein
MLLARRPHSLLLFSLFAFACLGAPLSASPQAGSSTRATAPPAAASAPAATKTQSDALVLLSSDEGRKRLERSRAKADFFLLVNQFEAQEHMGNCGPTTAVIVLNSLRGPDSAVERPVDAALFPAEHRKGLPPNLSPVPARYTQGTFLDARFEKVKSKAAFFGTPDASGARDPGLQLRQLHQILLEHGLHSSLRVVSDELDEASVRRELIENLAREGDYVIINYARGALGQPGGGHISPLGAYDRPSDSVLVLDVNPTRAPFVWVPMKQLVAALRTKDTIENLGYLLVQEGTPKGP